MSQSSTTSFEDSLAASQESSFLGYPVPQELISTADTDQEAELSPKRSEFKSTVSTPSKHGKSRPAGSLFIGLDLGTSRTCVQVVSKESDSPDYVEEIPTVVGYPREGILPGVLPENRTAFFGEEALNHKLHLNLVYPLQSGAITNLDATRDFLGHVKEQIGAHEDAELRAVIGIPSKAGEKARENLRLAATRIFDRLILIPEPFLAALGSRHATDNIDAIANSLFVDIGAGSTDICLIQGCYPSDEDQLSLNFAGDQVDEIIQESILTRYPDCGISIPRCRDIKERNSFVGEAHGPVSAPVMVRGKLKSLEVSEAIERGCNELLQNVFQGLELLIERADPESFPGLLQNIVITGGGSRIPGFASSLQSLLKEAGFDGCRVNEAGSSYKCLVSLGASIAAQHAEERQWQNLLR
jgi:rod shape-determining protein MreB